MQLPFITISNFIEHLHQFHMNKNSSVLTILQSDIYLGKKTNVHIFTKSPDYSGIFFHFSPVKQNR